MTHHFSLTTTKIPQLSDLKFPGQSQPC